MPKCLRRLHLFSSVGLWANARLIRQHFDNTNTKHDCQDHWEAIEGASSILERLDIPHPKKSESANVWRYFLARIVAAADDINAKKAKDVMSNPKDFMRGAVKFEPGNGDLAVRYIMLYASTTREVDDIFGVFEKASKKTSEMDVSAGRALKKDRLLTRDDQDNDAWWDFYKKAAELKISDEQAHALIARLEKEFPVE